MKPTVFFSTAAALAFTCLAAFVLLAAMRFAISLGYLESNEYISGTFLWIGNGLWFGFVLIAVVMLGLALFRMMRFQKNIDIDSDAGSNMIKIDRKAECTTERQVLPTQFSSNEILLHSLLDISSIYVVRTDIQGNYTYANRAFLETFVPSYQQVSIIGLPSLTYVIPEDQSAIMNTIEQCLATPGTPIFVRLRKPTIYGEIYSTEWEFNTICYADNVVTEVQCVGWNVTKRSQLEKQIHNEQKQISALMSAINSIVWEAEAETLQFTYVSEAAERMLGYPVEMWIASPTFWESHIHPDDREETLRFCAEATRAMQDHNFEYRFVKADNTFVWLRDIVTVLSQDNKPVSLKGVMIDITEQKNISAGLRAAEEHFRSAVNALGEGIVLQDENGRITFCNPRAEEILGFSMNQMKGLTSLDPRWKAVRKDGSPFPDEEYPAVQTLRTGVPQNNVVMGLHKADGSMLWILVNSQPIRYASTEKVSGVVVSFADITLQQEQEYVLLRTSEQLQLAIEGSGLGLWDWYVQSGETIFNERWAEIIGYSLAELAPISIDTWMQYCHPEDIIISGELLQAHFRKETEYYECEARMRHKSGKWVWVLDRGRVAEWNSDDKPHRMIGTHLDITARKEAEAALRQSEERFRLIVETEPECVKIVDNNGRLLEMNAAGLAMLEVQTVQEVQQKTLSSFILSPHRPAFAALHAQVMAGKSGVLEFEIVGKKGTRRWLETHAAPMKDAVTGAIAKLLGVTRDITERKRVEEEIRKTRDFYVALVSTVNVILWETDPATHEVLFISSRSKEMLGYAPEEWSRYSMFWRDHLHPDDRDRISQLADEYSTAGKNYSLEYRFLKPDGKVLWLRDVVTVETEDGKPKRLRGALVDITEKVEARIRLEEREQFISTLLETMPGVVYVYDIESEQATFVSRGVQKLLEYSDEEYAILSKNFHSLLMHPDDVVSDSKHRLSLSTLDKNEIAESSYRLRHKNGSWRWFYLRTTPFLYQENEMVSQVIGVALDVTALKDAEQALAHANTHLKSLLEAVPFPIAVTRMIDGKALFNNAPMQNLFDLSPDVEIHPSAGTYYQNPDDRTQLLKDLELRGRIDNRELILKKPTGEEWWAMLSIVVIDFEGEKALFLVFHDITARKRAEEQLRTSEANIRAIFDASVQIHCLLDTDFQLLTFNKIASDRARELLQRELLLGDSLLSYVPPSNKELFERHLLGALKGEVSRYEDSVYIAELAQKWWFEFQFISVYDANNSVVGVSFSALDITERKSMLIRMEEYSQELQSIIDSMMDGLIVLNEKQQIVLVNPALKEMFGYTEEELLGEELTKLIPERFHNIHQQHIETFALNDNNRKRTRIAVGQHAKGFEFPMDSSVASFQFGKSIMTLAILRDITESKAQDDKIRQSEANLRAIMDSSVQAYWLTDTELKVQTYNNLTAHIVHKTFGRDIIIGDSILNYIVPEQQERFSNSARKALVGEAVLYEEQFFGTNGEEQWLEVMYLPTYNAEGVIIGLTLSSFNITERKIAYQELTKLNDELEDRVEERTRELVKLNNEKNEFMGIAAHDLKNPLAGILTSAEILERYFSGDSSTQRFAKMIISASDQMLDIITNLLDVNRIESGSMKLHLQPVNIDMLEGIVEEHQNRAAQKGIFIYYDKPERDTAWVLGDTQSVRQILDNLISNAVKYSPHWKKVLVRVVHRHDAEGHFVRVEVQDEGPGLNEEDKQKLFGKFARLSAQPTGGENSTGLGLSIVKKLVEMQNGHIWCESTFGSGATFIVELPGA